MIRGNSFTVKSTFSLLLFLTSLFCFSISYQEISRIKLNYDLGFQEQKHFKVLEWFFKKVNKYQSSEKLIILTMGDLTN